MRKCKNCGFENNDEDIICKKCNYLLVEYDNKDNDNKEDNPIKVIVINSQQPTVNTNKNSYSYENGYYDVKLNEELFKEDENDRLQSISLKPKSTLLGIILSALMGGLGNIYAGLFKRGIFQLIVCIVLYYVTFYVAIHTKYYMLFEVINIMWNLYVLYDTYICINAINKKEKIPSLLGINIR